MKLLYEDDAILVVDKPAGQIVHPAPGHATGALTDELVAYCPSMRGVGSAERPGVVHRLDQDTSGVMVFAKTQEAYLALRRQFESHKDVRKTYLAVCHWPKGNGGRLSDTRQECRVSSGSGGRLSDTRQECRVSSGGGGQLSDTRQECRVSSGGGGQLCDTRQECRVSSGSANKGDATFLSREKGNSTSKGDATFLSREKNRPPLKGTLTTPVGRDRLSALTHYEVLGRRGPVALVRFDIETGRMHQIRIHAKELGAPLVGDPLYGSRELDAHLRVRPRRTLLHAVELSFLHPTTGRRVTFSAPPPNDIVHAI